MATRKQVTKLARELIKNLPSLNKSRIKLIALAVLSLAVVQTSNLVRIAAAMSTDCERASNYRRLQRFIDQVQWLPLEMMKLIVKWTGMQPPFVLLIDRTTWLFGNQPINILCVSILRDDYSVPLCWSLLDKKGNSNQSERIDLVQKVLDAFGAELVKAIIADREFTGDHWFKWLNNNNIELYIRVAKNRKVKRYGRYHSIQLCIRGHKRKGTTCNGKRYWLCGIQVFMHGFTFRNDKVNLEQLIVVSQSTDPAAIDLHAKRWYIENKFKDLKSNCFHLEKTLVKNLETLHTLFGLIVLTHAWAIMVGTYVKKTEPHLFKKTKNKRLRKSIFKAGLESLQAAFFTAHWHKIYLYLRFLSCI